MADNVSPNQLQRADTGSKSGSALSTGATSASSGRTGGGFFTVYKRGQGYWTRMGTLFAAILIGVLTGEFLYAQIHAHFEVSKSIAAAIGGGFLVLWFLFCWRLMNKARNVDFLIATDSEMKKVNWTSRRELIGSTKVVVVFVILIATILFVLDIAFGLFFQFIGVLESGPFG